MKHLITVLAFAVAGSAFAEVHQVTMADVTKRVSTENLYILENAQRVYQAKQTIQLARRNLLPRLNLWRIIEAPTNPRSLMGLVEDIAPFLVPNNWLRVKEEKLFTQATQHGHRSLWANELLTARGLLLQASLEERLLEALEMNVQQIERIYQVVKAREDLGAMPAGSARQLEIQILACKEEVQTLNRIIQENRSQLAYMMGFPGNDEAIPAQVKYMSMQAVTPLDYKDYEQAVLDASPEIKQFSALIHAAKYVKRERYFSFLGSSSMSRGVGGGVFDNLPAQDGLGFGLAPSLRIVRSQTKILKLQKEAVAETIRKNLKVLVESYNLDLDARKDASYRAKLTDEALTAIEHRMRLGEAVDVTELVQNAEARLEALSTYHSVEVRLLLNEDRLKRMQLVEDFQSPSQAATTP